MMRCEKINPEFPFATPGNGLNLGPIGGLKKRGGLIGYGWGSESKKRERGRNCKSAVLDKD
jgi:hypothetical protein